MADGPGALIRLRAVLFTGFVLALVLLSWGPSAPAASATPNCLRHRDALTSSQPGPIYVPQPTGSSANNSNLTISPDLRYAFTFLYSGQLFVVDSSTTPPTGSASIPGVSMTSGKVSPDGCTLYTVGTGGMSALDLTSMPPTVLSTNSLGGVSAFKIAIASDGSTAYLLTSGGIKIVELSGSTMTESRTIASPASRYLGAVNVSADERFLYVSYDGNKFATYDVSVSPPVRLSTLTIGPTTLSANEIAVAPLGDRVYVSDNGHQSFSMIDVTTPGSPILTTVPLDDYAYGDLAVSPDGSRLYVTGEGFGIWVFDATTTPLPTQLRDQDIAFGSQLYGMSITVDGRFGAASNTTGVWLFETGYVPPPLLGPDVPTAPMQSYGRARDESCEVNAPAWVNWEGIASLQFISWGLSWQEWPNDHTGGWVCERQPFYTTTHTWAVR